ncbi:phenylacetate--CoA ligase family protein [Candidatus Beckwithbacteria bacterium]|nr:phenylacetate--CoA ligase family protein [Candidatus Beckwithbacteria bacterium]
MKIKPKNIYLKLKEIIIKKKLVDLEKSQYWTINELKNFQNERLKKIINYAYKNIKGYRDKFNQVKIKPNDINSSNDLYKIPILTREEIQENPAFINPKLIHTTLYTGGSTGKSLIYYDDQQAGIMRWNCHYRGWKYQGYNVSKKLAVISAAKKISINHKILTLNGQLEDKYLRQNIEAIVKFRPEFLRGYVGSIYILGKYILEKNIKIDFIKAIDPVSENLYEYQKKIMQKAFNAPVFEEYCCNDGGACAWECEKHQGLHWAMERAIIEEKNGEMITTDLWNKAMPFIRYKNGDKVKFLKNKCCCGRTLPLIKVKGRDNDIIIAPKGPIGATFLMYHGIGYGDKNSFRTGIRIVQYVQEKNYQLNVNIVKSANCTQKQIDGFKKAVKTTCHQMKIKFNFIKDIKGTKIGKRQFIINNDHKLLEKWK